MRLPIVVTSLILALPFTIPPKQGGGGVLGGSGLGNCEIDLRPKDRREAQVYWEENEHEYGVTYEVWVPEGVALKAGDANADGEVPLTVGKNLVTFTYEKGAGDLLLTITPYGKTAKPYPKTPYRGTFDRLGSHVAPIKEVVRPEDPETGKERSRITFTDFGLTYSFTITNV